MTDKIRIFMYEMNHQTWREIHNKFVVEFMPRTEGIQPESEGQIVSALEPVRVHLRSVTRDI